MKVVKHQFANADANVSSGLGNARLPTIEAKADDEISATSTNKLNPLTAMAGREQGRFHLVRTLYTL